MRTGLVLLLVWCGERQAMGADVGRNYMRNEPPSNQME